MFDFVDILEMKVFTSIYHPINQKILSIDRKKIVHYVYKNKML